MIGDIKRCAGGTSGVALACVNRLWPASSDGHVQVHAIPRHVKGHCQDSIERVLDLTCVVRFEYRRYGSLFVEFTRVVSGDHAIIMEVVHL
jgi:hypothetical protein